MRTTELIKDVMSQSTVSAPHQDQVPGLICFIKSLSALDPGDQVVEQKEDNDQPHRDVAEDASVVPPGSNHGGESLHAAAQQARRTQKV